MTCGEFPDNCVLIAYIRTKSEISQYNKKIKEDSVVILTKGDEIDYFASGENKVLTLAVERELFFKTFNNYFGEPFELHKNKKHFMVEEGKSAELTLHIFTWMNHLKNTYLPEQYEKIESAILGSIFEFLDINMIYQGKINYNIFDIRAILEDNLRETITISDIADQIDISERHMRRLFKEAFGISPKNYLQNLRLNAVKKELITQDKKYTKVTSIAYKYNFFNMGYFSQEYKKFFGELPSHTLQNK
jgi:AraC-like DNA-binding protein